MKSRIREMIDTDVVVVGGGLAGLSTALAITARSDARLTLVEPSVGSNRSLPLTFCDVLDRFGLNEYILSRYHSFALHARTGERATCTFDEPVLATLDYSQACLTLYKRLQNRPMFSHRLARAETIMRDNGIWRVQTTDGAITGKLLIDASGLAELSRRHSHPRPGMYSHSYGQILECRSIPQKEQDTALFLTGNPRHGNGGGWFYPMPDGRASFGFAQVTRSPQYPRSQCIRGYEWALQEFAPYNALLYRGRHVDTHLGTIPLGAPKHFAYDGLMLVGDAAGQATPWACMGTEPALLNGEMCGEVAAIALRGDNLSARHLREYERRWKSRNYVAYRKATMLAELEWNRGERPWQDTVRWTSTLSPKEMLSNVRYNTPHASLPILWWLLIYDRLGLARRSIRDRLLQRVEAEA
jgi:flavin-dependent dehydrogenase